MNADELVKYWPCEGCPLHHVGRAAPDADEPSGESCDETGGALDCANVRWTERMASIAMQTADAVRRMQLPDGGRRHVADVLGSALDGLLDDGHAALDWVAFRAACGLVEAEVPDE